MTATDKSRGMLFSAPMVLSLLNTKPGVWPAEPIDPSKPFKSQTRRLLKEQPSEGWYPYSYGEVHKMVDEDFVMKKGEPVITGWGPSNEMGDEAYACPHPVGSLIYVKETHQLWDHSIESVEVLYQDGTSMFANVERDRKPNNIHARRRDKKKPWRPSIFMHKWASRMLLEVMDVRAERCCDISPEDAIAEGVEKAPGGFKNYLYKPHVLKTQISAFGKPEASYQSLITSIHGPDAWDKYVWAYSLKRLK